MKSLITLALLLALSSTALIAGHTNNKKHSKIKKHNKTKHHHVQVIEHEEVK